MKKLLYILGTVLSVVVLFSCEPGRAENGELLFNVDEPSYDWEPRFLSKVSNSAGENIIYKYDTSDRLTDVNYTRGNTSAFQFTYEPNSIKTNSAVVTYENLNTIFTSTLAFEYNTDNSLSQATGIIDQDGTKLSDIKIEVEYTDTRPSKITSTVTPVKTPSNVTRSENTLVYDGEGLASWTKTLTSGGNVDFEQTIAFTAFDNKRNAFAKLPMVYRILSTVYNEGPWGVAGFSKNNFKKITVDGESAEYIYKYDPKKYPTEASTTGKKFTFLYKN